MAKAFAREPLKDLSRLAQEIRGDVLKRWVAKAQKSALLEWRDRVLPPGLAARFTIPGRAFYRFAYRFSAKTSQPPFLKTGAFRNMLMNRRPRTSYKGLEVVTRLKFGGGPLNFLGNRRGWTSLITTATGKARVAAARTYVEEFGAFQKDQPWIERKIAINLRRIYRSAAYDRRTGKIKDNVRLHPQAEAT
jgi:hypothetical protein